MKHTPNGYNRAGSFAADLERCLTLSGRSARCRLAPYRAAVYVSRSLAAAVCLFFIVTANSYARGVQVPEPPLPVDPRPLTQLISAAEKASLAESNPKRLIEAYLKISDTHLQAAFSLIRVNNHGAAERELDVYNKAVAAAGKETFALQDGKRGLSKRIEQVLYRQIKTLETIDRLFPVEREMFADAALKHAKQLRVQALNEAFASGDVLKDPDEEKKPKSEPPDKDSPPDGPALLPSQTRAVSGQTLVSLRRPSQSRGVISARFTSKGLSLQMPGDYLTEEEDEHVREAQAPDERTKVFMKIADRRLKAIANPPSPPTDKKDQKKVEEENKEWGAVPKVSRADLLRHYARAISECMAKLEDAYERNPKGSGLPKALTALRDATDKHLLTLRALKPEVKPGSEADALSGAIYEAETANKGARDGLK